jgi:transcriptional regulator with XRE-family HTH domain
MIKNRIKEYRAKYGMKQEELAAKVGVRRELRYCYWILCPMYPLIRRLER